MADELKAKVLAYEFDGLGQAGFARLLAEEERIAVPLAEKITGEYLRFVYLTQVSDTPLTPSIQVDMAWHLHLTRTRDYWEGLCAGVLGKKLHHDAETGKAARELHKTQYEKTRTLYAAVFEEAPPLHIWPSGSRPYAKAKPAPGRTAVFGVGLALTAMGLSQVANGVLSGGVFVVVGGALLGSAILMSRPRRHRREKDSAGCTATCGAPGAAPTGGFLGGTFAGGGDDFGGGSSDGGGASCGGGGCGGGD